MSYAAVATRYDAMFYRRTGRSGLKLPAQQVLERAGLLYPSPLMDSWRTEAETLAALRQAEGSPTAPEAPRS